MKKFILVTGKPTADELTAAGFHCVCRSGEQYFFLNQSGTFAFSDTAKKHMMFTNTLYL